MHGQVCSQSSTWLPEGPGYSVFSSLPTGFPGIAPFKADSEWHRTDVGPNVNRWIQQMDLTDKKRYHAEQCWFQKLNTIPSVASDLQPSQISAWPLLPLRADAPASTPGSSAEAQCEFWLR